METSWGEQIVRTKEYTSTEAVSIDCFDILDSTDEKHIIAVDESEPLLRIFAKVSRDKAKQHLARSSRIETTRRFSKEIVEAKPEVVRGSKCTSINDGYAVLGIRPNRNNSQNGVYVFEKNVEQHTIDELEREAAHIVEQMQESLRCPFAKFLYRESTVMTKVVQQTTITSIGDHATAFSIGEDYHSKCHVDEDYYYTHLTVIGFC
eukprot:jgi/Psemu1/48220/gm1.48220_g